MCSMAPYDWANGGSIGVLSPDGYGFSSIGGCCYSRVRVCGSRIKVFCIASEKLNASKVLLQEFDIKYGMSAKKEGRLYQWLRYVSGLMVSKSECKSSNPRLFSRKGG